LFTLTILWPPPFTSLSMRFYDAVMKALPLVVTFASIASASPLGTELDITATATFPATNPFAHVVNGERNKMSLEIENKSPVNVTLKSAAGSFHDPDSGKLLKNTTTLTYGVTLVSGAKTILPYNFHSEHKPRDVTLKIWVNYDDGSPSGLHHITAYDSVVSVVEPPSSFFDLPLLFSYVVMAALLGGGGYLVYQNYVPKTKKRKVRKNVNKEEISSPVGPTAAAKSYDEDWIPSHHLKKKAKAQGAASSGDESAPEKRKGRKGKQ